MRKLLSGIAIASAFTAACGSGPNRTPDAFFEGFDAGPPDAPFGDAFRPSPDAFMPIGTDAAMMAMDDAAMMATDDAGGMVADDAAMMAMSDAGAMIDAATPSDAGTDAGLPPVANDTCATATVATAGTLTGNSLGAVNDYGSGANCSGTAGVDVVYAIDVPAGQIAQVSVTSGDGSFDPSISLVDATCGGSPRSCLDGDDSGTASAVNTAFYTNSTASSARIYAVVDSFSSSSRGGPFTLTVDLLPPAANDTCATATPLTPGTYTGTNVGASDDYGTGTGCVATGGPDVVYAIDVPAGQRLSVSVTGPGSLDPSINLLAGPAATCGGSPHTCLAGNSTAVTWTNTGAATTVYAVVDTAAAMSFGTFEITVGLETPPPGDVCGTAVRVTPGMYSGTTVGYLGDYGSGSMCSGTSGADRVYVVSVGAGQTLTADVTSADGSFDPSISLEAACGLTPRVCIAGSDAGTATTVNTVTYMNTSAVAEDIFIVIDTTFSGETGTFTMNVALAP